MIGTTYASVEALENSGLPDGSIVVSALGTAVQSRDRGVWVLAAPTQPRGGLDDAYDAPFTLVYVA